MPTPATAPPPSRIQIPEGSPSGAEATPETEKALPRKTERERVF